MRIVSRHTARFEHRVVVALLTCVALTLGCLGGGVQDECEGDSDCEDGFTCERDDDGARVCERWGGTGEACEVDSDCAHEELSCIDEECYLDPSYRE